MNLSFITFQLHPITELPVIPTVPIAVFLAFVIYVWGRFGGWMDCLHRSEKWEGYRQTHNQRINMQRSAFPLKDYQDHQPGEWVPKRRSA